MSDDHGHGGGHGGGHGAHGNSHGGGNLPAVAWTVIFIGVGAVILWYVFGSLWNNYERVVGTVSTVHHKPSICNGLKKAITYGREPVEINPNGECQLDLWYDQCIYVQSFQSSIPHYVCPMGTNATLPNDIQLVWSGGDRFTGAYQLNPPFEDKKKTTLFEFRE